MTDPATTASVHVESPAQKLRDRPYVEREVDRLQQDLFAAVAAKIVQLKHAGLTPLAIWIHAETAKKAEVERLDMLYALPVVSTMLYREERVVVLGAFL